MNATQVELQGGQKWRIYSVKDVESLVCLGLHPTLYLSGPTARPVLQAAIGRLVEYGVTRAEAPVVIQSDGGSDFTSQGFRDTPGKWGYGFAAK